MNPCRLRSRIALSALVSLTTAPAVAQDATDDAPPAVEEVPEEEAAEEEEEDLEPRAPLGPDSPRAEPPTSDLDSDDTYHTPLAGEPFETTVFDRKVVIERRDRSRMVAVTLGGAAYSPKIGDTVATPMLAVFIKYIWNDPKAENTDRYFQATLAGLVNDVELAEDFGPIDPLVHLETDYRRVATAGTEVIDGEEIDGTALEWGWSGAWLGFGLRERVWPFNVDNELRIEAFYKARYTYFDDKPDLLDSIDVPPDTFEHGIHLRFRVDMIQRNLLELPHYGVGFGADLEVMRRDRWPEVGQLYTLIPDAPASGETRDYARLSAYVVLAGGLPILSERHRFMLRLQGGWSPPDDLDRFSAFRLGGGPLPKEASDLPRVTFPGALFGQFISQRYGIVTFEYRYEILFFLYMHLSGTFLYTQAPEFAAGGFRFEDAFGWSSTVALTSGFIWESQLHVAYSLGGSVVRGGDVGNTVLLLWSKSF